MGHVPNSSVMSVVTTFGPVLVGVMQFRMYGRLSASGDRTHVSVGAGKCCHPLWSGRQPAATSEEQGHRLRIGEHRQPRVGTPTIDLGQQVPDGDEMSGGRGGQTRRLLQIRQGRGGDHLDR